MISDMVDYDFLPKCTKDELITLIKNKSWFNQLFTFRDVLSIRWNNKNKQLIKKEERLSEALDKIDAKKLDELAMLFNATTDVSKGLGIIKKMIPIEKQFKDWFLEDRVLQKERVKVEKLRETLMSLCKHSDL